MPVKQVEPGEHEPVVPVTRIVEVALSRGALVLVLLPGAERVEVLFDVAVVLVEGADGHLGDVEADEDDPELRLQAVVVVEELDLF